MEVLGEDRKANETKIGVVEARLNNHKVGLNIIASTVSIIKTQMDQVQKKAKEKKAKLVARVAEINKKWVTKSRWMNQHLGHENQGLWASQRATGLNTAGR